MLPRPCLTCGRLTYGSHCPEHAPAVRNGSTGAWRRLRERVLTRAGGRCERCGALAVDVHHRELVCITGRADNEDPARLEALCERCHNSVHG